MSETQSTGQQPLLLNPYTSQVTHRQGLDIVNHPEGVVLAWKPEPGFDPKACADANGFKKLNYQTSTDMQTGETDSLVSVEMTHEEYEEFRQRPHVRTMELPAMAPEGTGNTLGQLTFIPPTSNVRAEHANPPELPPEEQTPQLDNSEPNEHLQALINKSKDDRSFWQRTKEGTASAWSSTKRIAGESWEHPGEFGKGLLKGVGNLPSDLANLAVESIKNGGGINPLNPNNYSKYLDYSAVKAYESGNLARANALASQSASIQEMGNVGDIFELENDAQKGGSFASILIPVGTLVKASASTAKAVKAAKTLDTAADAAKVTNTASEAAKATKATKAADTAGDVNKASEAGSISKTPGPKGNGGKVAVGKKLKKKDVPCFKKNKKGAPKEYDRQLKGQQDGLNNMTAKEYLDGRAAYTGNRASTAAARDKYQEQLSTSYLNSGTAKTISEADRMASDKMKTLNALHNPDMYAGGKDVIADFGDAGVNKSIGSQWNKTPAGEAMSRVEMLDKEAKEAVANGNGDHKMNANMHRCP